MIKLTIFILLLGLFNILNVNAATLTFDGDKVISGSNTGTNDIMISVISGEKSKSRVFN